MTENRERPDEERAAFERRVARIVGERLLGVRYYRLEGDRPGAWRRGNGAYHTVEQGIDLVAASGRVFRITWDDEFVEYGVALAEATGDGAPPGGCAEDVSSHEPWVALLGEPIVSVTVHWRRLDDRPYPQDVELAFGTGQRVLCSAAGSMDRGDDERASEALTLFADQVTVVWTAEIAARYGLGRHG